MLKRFTILASCLFAVAQTASSQVMYDTFDDVRNVTYGLDVPFPDQLQNGIGGTVWPGWHGTFIQYIENPGANGVNSSDMCAQYTRNASETYDVILINCGELADLSGHLSGANQMTMDVFAPVPGITIQISLQNELLALGGYPQGRHSEYQAVTTTGGQWETLTFTLTGQPWIDPSNSGWWPDANTANNDVNQMVLLFNPGVNINENYYFDNLSGPARVNEACAEVNTDSEMLMDADCENDRFDVEYKDGRLSIFPNPDQVIGGNVLEYARNGGATDDVIVGDFNGALNILPLTTLSFDFYDPNAPTNIVFSIQDNFGLELGLFNLASTASNTWETLTMDLAALTGLPNATNFVLLIAPGEPLAETFYIDNLKLVTEVSVTEKSDFTFNAYPNPATTAMQVTWDTAGSVEYLEVIDLSGRIVQTQATQGLNSAVVEGLASGVYVLRLTAGDKVAHKQVVFGATMK